MLPGRTPPTDLPPVKLSRAARQHANRVKRLQTETEALARAAAPPVRLDADQSAPGLPGVSLPPTGQEHDLRSKSERQEIIGTGQLPVGRPSSYTDDEGDIICAWIQGGGSLRGYSASTGRSVQTVYRWMREATGFQARYAQAHEDRADTLTDEMLEIADASATDASIEGVAAAKLRVEARKWIASKLRPQKWGDKQVVEHVGAVNIRIGIPAKPQQTAPTAVEMVDRIS